jgi:hypothetical protein
MAGRLSMVTKAELVASIGDRASTRAERTKILDEFAAVTGYHRKHATLAQCLFPNGSHAIWQSGRRPRRVKLAGRSRKVRVS